MMEFISLLRILASTYQKFETVSNKHVKTTGLTPAQFDVIVTLGCYYPMSCAELGNRTLITKGTLTGVLERMEEKGFIQKEINSTDRRSVNISLTVQGRELFELHFPEHTEYLNKFFKKLTSQEIDEIKSSLLILAKVFEKD